MAGSGLRMPTSLDTVPGVIAVAVERTEGQLDQSFTIELLSTADLAEGGEGRVDEDSAEVEERGPDSFAVASRIGHSDEPVSREVGRAGVGEIENFQPADSRR